MTVYVHSGPESAMPGAVVTGSWSGGATGAATCTTNIAGLCNVSANGLLMDSVPSVRLTVNGVSLAGYNYSPVGNHDPDGESDGTSIVVSRP